jgi:hydroxymethylbilane synthase
MTPATAPLFRLGARGSPLSRAQAERVQARLAAAMEIAAERIEFVPIVTSGDRNQGLLPTEGAKGLFTKEIDEALLGGRLDLAVHSMKDLPTLLPDGVAVAAVPEREDPRDAFVSLRARTLGDLPPGARFGTSSPRRAAQALHARPDLRVVPLRGNVATRLDKLKNGEADAALLALAGLKRLGLEGHAASLVDPRAMPPAACQGALAVTARAEDAARYFVLNDARASTETAAERAFLAAFEGSCRTPIAAWARLAGARLDMLCEALSLDGVERVRREEALALGADPGAEAEALGRRLGEAVRAAAAAFIA